MTKLERIIKTSPPYDKRHPNPSKNYGIGSLKIRFVVKGKRGAIQFLVSTHTYLKDSAEELIDTKSKNIGYMEAWDLGYHSKKPMYKGQGIMSDKCEFTDGICYYDGTSLGVEEPLKIYLSEGEEALWKYLENIYMERFEKERVG